jgi:hypothetical protein
MISMESVVIDELLSKAVRAENQKLCPECGARMDEAERCCESGIVFVWYRCSRSACAGQWLNKMSQRAFNPGVDNPFPAAVRPN